MSGSLRQQSKAIVKENFGEIRLIFLQKAASGDTDAMLFVAESYRKGQNSFEENLPEAARWYEKLYNHQAVDHKTRTMAAWGLFLARQKLNSIARAQGQAENGTEDAEMEALYVFLIKPEYPLREAWIQENLKLIKIRLAEIYLNRDITIPEELTRAVELLEEVGNDGFHEAWFLMVEAYENKRLLTDTPEERLQKMSQYLAKITKPTDPEVMMRLAIMHHYPEDNRFKDILKAKCWYEKAANAGNARGMLALAEMYRLGDGKAVSKHLKKSKEWFEQIVNTKNIPEEILALAYFRLGVFFESPEGKEKPDFKNALHYYQTAAVRGYIPAQLRAAVLLEEKARQHPEKRAENFKNSFTYYECVAKSESPSGVYQDCIREAQFRLAVFYEEGKGGIDQDFRKAIEYYEKIAHISPENQVPQILEYLKIAQFRLGELYLAGSGVTQGQNECLETAISWYEKAQSNGYVDENVQDKIVTAQYQLAESCALSPETRLFEKAFRLYETVANNHSENADVQKYILNAKRELIQYYRGEKGVVQQDLAKALGLCQAILTADPSDAYTRAISMELNDLQQSKTWENAPFLLAYPRKPRKQNGSKTHHSQKTEKFTH